ncbi:MAG: hypothetical protein MPJ24_10130 [Pirellulaceae bacterium]|nr:hypothetical protein [Pirellulaceae bacterium]
MEKNFSCLGIRAFSHRGILLLLVWATCFWIGCAEGGSIVLDSNETGSGQDQKTQADENNSEEQEPTKKELVKAEVGVGKKTQNLSEDNIINASGHALIRSRKRLSFLQVTHALNLYKGLHGTFPKTEEAFWEDVVKANQLVLPELDEGKEYVYDPKAGELFVESNR